MPGVQHAKLRLIREAIQHNVETLSGATPRPPAGRRRAVHTWLWAVLLTANIAVLSAPSHVVSRSTPAAPRLFTTEPAIMWELPDLTAATPEVPLSPPHPVSGAVFRLAVKRVVIDPGHGGQNLGAVSASGVPEKEITLDIAHRLQRLAQDSSFEAVMTRQGDQTLPLEDRVKFANANNADVFVSIHVNWLETRKVRPLETFFVGPTADPAALRLAHLENRDSGYSLSDYRQLLEKVFLDERRAESRRLATTVQTELYQSLRTINPLLDNRGVKMAPFVVLVGTRMPAILAEVSCLSNEDEVKLLMNADYRETIATALLKGIRSYAGSLNAFSKKGG
jgi:N-acetylmuramoyl-L-alanine amidase